MEERMKKIREKKEKKNKNKFSCLDNTGHSVH